MKTQYNNLDVCLLRVAFIMWHTLDEKKICVDHANTIQHNNCFGPNFNFAKSLSPCWQVICCFVCICLLMFVHR